MPRWLKVLALILLEVQVNSASCFSEERKTLAESVILIPGALSRVESYGPMGSWRLCSPQSVGLTEWRSNYLEHLIRPSKSQMEMLGKLQTASAAAKKIIASSCTKETVSTGPIHLAEMQKRLSHTKLFTHHSTIGKKHCWTAWDQPGADGRGERPSTL
jgi:hypothetical protein